MGPGWDSTKREEGPKDRVWQPPDLTPILPRLLAAAGGQVILHMNQQSLGSG